MERPDSRLGNDHELRSPDECEEKLAQCASNMHRLIVTARNQINTLKHENATLQKQIDSAPMIRCPSCTAVFKEKLHRVLPSYMKILRGRTVLEMEFTSLDALEEYLAVNGLDVMADGTPTLLGIRPDGSSLAAVGSCLPGRVSQPQKERQPGGAEKRKAVAIVSPTTCYRTAEKQPARSDITTNKQTNRAPRERTNRSDEHSSREGPKTRLRYCKEQREAQNAVVRRAEEEPARNDTAKRNSRYMAREERAIGRDEHYYREDPTTRARGGKDNRREPATGSNRIPIATERDLTRADSRNGMSKHERERRRGSDEHNSREGPATKSRHGSEKREEEIHRRGSRRTFEESVRNESANSRDAECSTHERSSRSRSNEDREGPKTKLRCESERREHAARDQANDDRSGRATAADRSGSVATGRYTDQVDESHRRSTSHERNSSRECHLTKERFDSSRGGAKTPSGRHADQVDCDNTNTLDEDTSLEGSATKECLDDERGDARETDGRYADLVDREHTNGSDEHNSPEGSEVKMRYRSRTHEPIPMMVDPGRSSEGQWENNSDVNSGQEDNAACEPASGSDERVSCEQITESPDRSGEMMFNSDDGHEICERKRLSGGSDDHDYCQDSTMRSPPRKRSRRVTFAEPLDSSCEVERMSFDEDEWNEGDDVDQKVESPPPIADQNDVEDGEIVDDSPRTCTPDENEPPPEIGFKSEEAALTVDESSDRGEKRKKHKKKHKKEKKRKREREKNEEGRRTSVELHESLDVTF